MLTDEEWRIAYEYLLRRVGELTNASSVVVELQQVTQMRFEDDLEPNKIERRLRKRRATDDAEFAVDLFGVAPDGETRVPHAFSKGERQDLDVVRNRAPKPREVFVASVDVLIARLREFPALATRLQVLYERDSENLQWRPDASGEEFASTQETFSVGEFSLDERSRSDIESALNRILELLAEER